VNITASAMAYETLDVIAAILPPNQNASGAIGNCWVTPSSVRNQSDSRGCDQLIGKGTL